MMMTIHWKATNANNNQIWPWGLGEQPFLETRNWWGEDLPIIAITNQPGFTTETNRSCRRSTIIATTISTSWLTIFAINGLWITLPPIMNVINGLHHREQITALLALTISCLSHGSTALTCLRLAWQSDGRAKHPGNRLEKSKGKNPDGFSKPPIFQNSSDSSSTGDWDYHGLSKPIRNGF